MSSVLTTKSVIGGIDGRKLVSDTTQWPYRAAGYVKMIYNVLDNETGLLKPRKYVGSAFLEGPDLLVTAGHCVYGDVTTSYETKDGVIHTEFEDYFNNFRFPDEMIYYPAQNGLNYQPYGQVSVDRVYIEKSYYLNTKKDWACAKLSNSIGDQTGWLGKIADFYKENQSFISFGYPGSKEGKMYVAEAQFTQFEDNSWYHQTNLDSEGGQSVAPYRVTLDLGESYVSGIHTYSVGNSYSGGIRIDTFMFHFLNSFVAKHNVVYREETIKHTDYGFADAYPIDDYTKDNFVDHQTSDGFTFRTKRYRTGYIHNEYVVMSCIKTNITEAFIEYEFDEPIYGIVVDLVHWR